MRRIHGGFLASAFAAWAIALSSISIADESSVVGALISAREAYKDGNYRHAAGLLNGLAKSEAGLSTSERLQYWDLSADVALESGLLDVAQKAARTHLAIVRESAGDTQQAARATAEQLALVRMARIERGFCPAETGKDLPDETAVAHWSKSHDLLAESLAIRGGMRQTDPMWEAETRLQLARTLSVLGRLDEARDEFAAASKLTAAVFTKMDATRELVQQFLRGAAVVQNSCVAGERDAENRQANATLKLIERWLGIADLTAGDRFGLLSAEAACRRQLQDVPGETVVLTAALRSAGESDQVDNLRRAEITLRLAELADTGAGSAQSQQAIDRYRAAVQLYAQILADGRLAKPQAAASYRRLSPGQQAECLIQLQLIYVRLSDWDAAIAAAEDLLEVRSRALLSSGDPNYFRAKTAVGSLYAKSARSAFAGATGEVRDLSAARRAAEQAQSHLKDAAQFWRGYRPLSRKDLAATLNYYAEALRYAGDFRRANQLLDEAAPHFVAAYDANALERGEFRSNRGAVLAAIGMFQPALESYEAAIAAAQSHEADNELRARGQLTAYVYLNLAQLYKSQGQFSPARNACALAGRNAAKWLAGNERVPFLLADAALGIAEAERLYRSAGMNPAVGEAFAAAINATEKAIDESAGDADSLNADNARHLQALAHFRRHLLTGSGDADLVAAQRLWIQIADSPRPRADLRGDVLRVRALNALAVIALREAGALRARARGAAEEDSARQLVQQGNERLAEAGRRSAEAEQIAENMVAYPAVLFQVLLTRAQVLNADAQVQQARAGESSGAERIRSIEKSQLAAIAALERALALIERPRAMTTGAEEQRAAYFAQFSPGFDLLVDLLMKRGESRSALEASEQRRSRTFLDQMRIAGVDLNDTVPGADRHLVEAAQGVRDQYYTCLARLIEEGTKGATTSDSAAELAELQGRLVEAEGRVRAASPVYRHLLTEPLLGSAAGDAALTDGEWVRRQLHSEDVALVYYVGAENCYVFESSAKEGIRGTPLKISAGQARRLGLPVKTSADGEGKDRPLREEDVAKLVGRIAGDVSRPPDDAGGSRGAGLQNVSSAKIQPKDLALVTDILLPQELRKRIADSSCPHVLVVPDGPLHQLAFESLPIDADRKTYLLDVFPPVCYVPSLAIYRQLQERAIDDNFKPTMVSVADPSYREATGTERQATPVIISPQAVEFLHYFGAGVLPRLPATRLESDEVRKAFEKLRLPTGDVLALTEDKATEGRVKEALAQWAASKQHAGFLHVAAHGLVDQRYNNLFGALALTPPSNPSATDDGFLTLYEVMMLPLAGCDLAVLSACETNCGPENALEAGSTMARAFLCAGARRVVCSQWKVSDEATAELVADFMDRVTSDLAEGRVVDYAAALQRAKRRLRPREATSSPYFWAPFVLIGSPTSGPARPTR